jgi:hypothetical protein
MVTTPHTTRPSARRRLRSALLAVVTALAVGITLLPVAAGAPASTKVVGEVVAVGGSKNLTTTDPATGKLHRVKRNDQLTLGQVLVMGARVTATLRVRRPKGVSADRELIDLKPVAGTPHRVRVTLKGAYTIVTILPG